MISRQHQTIERLTVERDRAAAAASRLQTENHDLELRLLTESYLYDRFADRLFIAAQGSVLAPVRGHERAQPAVVAAQEAASASVPVIANHSVAAAFPVCATISVPVLAAATAVNRVYSSASASASLPNLHVRRKALPPPHGRGSDEEEGAAPRTTTGFPGGPMIVVPIAVAQAEKGVVLAADHDGPSNPTSQAATSGLARVADENRSTTSLRDRLRSGGRAASTRTPVNKASISAPVAHSFVATPQSLNARKKPSDTKVEEKAEGVLRRFFGRLGFGKI